MADCVFCQIIDGEIPSRTVYEDEDVLAFLDVNPLARGHTLVIPPAVEAAVGADASTIGMNNGPASGQEVPHGHVHVVPRFEGDGVGPLHALDWPAPELDDDEFDDVQAAISDRA